MTPAVFRKPPDIWQLLGVSYTPPRGKLYELPPTIRVYSKKITLIDLMI